ncbi:MAG: hypothetical protein GW748_02120 [Alphaproteobacteria bacterium]|nr:hypothetical protein [Alphaproteobacteria bacterium]NCQ66523.1 hypothetical protein [Alphaproteobacteria bacterium]NCT08314.1 hypothetical protein [Alphaproteobacteria bacterium]
MDRQAFFTLFLGLFSAFFLSSCDTRKEWQYHDPKLAYQKQDYDQLTKAPVQPFQKRHKKKRVSFYTPPPIPLAFKKDVTVTVTNSVPLKELFLALAQQIGVDIIIDPQVTGGTTLHATGRPMIDVVDEICRSQGLRYRINNSILRIEKDTPFAHNYNLQFLLMARANRNRLSIATDVFTTLEGGTRPDEDNGSNTYLTAETKTDFWEELSDNLSIILNDFSDVAANGDQPPQGKYSIHKQAGIISIYATQAKHQQLRRYLDILQKSIERQVLIEAKIVEVNLKDQFKTGINWNALKGDFVLQMPLGDIATPGHLNETLPPPRNVFTLGGNAQKITGLLSLLNHFGTVRTLSNPRLTVMNNNPAVLKVAKNKVYFKLNYTREHSYFDKQERTYYSSDVKTVPIGLMMYVHPSISENGRIIMTLRPTISQISREVPDPAVGIASNQALQSLVPEVQVRELDSILSMNSGEIVVVGGLMEERSSNERDGVPEIEDVPLLGELFKGKSNDRTVTELVIFLRATIIENEDEPFYEDTSISKADKTAYQGFTQDPRPLQF